ncbi:hypothetical protein, partial [Desulfococcus sp.]|uniref:hypothetical protein n=1 Tax=Desulfococcus sp. TaxID=2025834 RepID=UPI003593A58A
MSFPTDDILEVDPADFRVSLESVGRYFGGSRYRITDRSRGRIEAGIQDARALVTPMAVFAVHAVERTGASGAIRLESGVALDLPCCGDPAGARWLSAGVA